MHFQGYIYIYIYYGSYEPEPDIYGDLIAVAGNHLRPVEYNPKLLLTYRAYFAYLVFHIIYLYVGLAFLGGSVV